MRGKPILCLDFDGVLHSYTSGWKGADVVPDEPVAGAAQFIADAQKHFSISVHSSRSSQPGGIDAMKKWLHKAIINADLDGSVFDAIQWPTEKPPALITIDDRALTFMGTWPRMSELLAFQPWNKRPTGPTGDFPLGRLNADDDGGLKIGIAADKANGIVRVDFGKPVAWIGLDKTTALDLARRLTWHAEKLKAH